jgi:hypothetical protein
MVVLGLAARSFRHTTSRHDSLKRLKYPEDLRRVCTRNRRLAMRGGYFCGGTKVTVQLPHFIGFVLFLLERSKKIGS